MSNAFTNFLGGVVSGVFGPGPNLKDYQHANRLYVRNTYARAPKSGFLYFVALNINPNAIIDQKWGSSGRNEVGLLVKKVDLPKFTVTTETLNQYNRKAIIQNKIIYSPITFDFHDDNSDITINLWKNYYRYYYADSNYNTNLANNVPTEFKDTKYGTVDYSYGLDNSQQDPFFHSIDIFVLHQQKFTRYTLINPIITEWAHDNLDQNAGEKILQNKMTVAYENVLYNSGKIQKGEGSGEFAAIYYDKEPSPLSVSGNGTNTLFGAGGVIAGADSVLGNLANGNFLAAAIAAKNTARNIGQINKAVLSTEVSSIFNTTVNEVRAAGRSPTDTVVAQGGANRSGVFLWNSGDFPQKTYAQPANITKNRIV